VWSAHDIFDFDKYLENVKVDKPFIQKFLHTQAFINFIEQSYYEEQGNLTDASLHFFKQCIRKGHEESIQSAKQLQEGIIQDLLQKASFKGIKYSINKCFEIYNQALKRREGMNHKMRQGPYVHPSLVRVKPAQKRGVGCGLIFILDHSRIVKFDSKFCAEECKKEL